MQRVSFSVVLRMILTTVYTFAAVLMQCSVFPYLRFHGAIPEVVLCAVVCVACFEKPGFSCILAVCAGFLLDTAGADKMTLSPLLFLSAACLSIILSGNVYSNKIIPAVISGSAALTLGGVRTALMLVHAGAPLSAVMVRTVLPQTAYGAVIFVLVFAVFSLHYRIFRDKDEKKRVRRA